MPLRPLRSIARWTFAKLNRAMQLGRPPDKARDYHRYERVKELIKEQGISKTRAVELLAADEGASEDTRGIWRSLARVKSEQTTRQKLL
jgi:predicted urease superfamily metal-dependent hydrolase